MFYRMVCLNDTTYVELLESLISENIHCIDTRSSTGRPYKIIDAVIPEAVLCILILKHNLHETCVLYKRDKFYSTYRTDWKRTDIEYNKPVDHEAGRGYNSI